MIESSLFLQPVALQRDVHRALRWMGDKPDFARTAQASAIFLTAVEMPEACVDFPLVFVAAGDGADGKQEVAPMAVLGLQQGENLMLDGAGEWMPHYVPAMLRAYPLAIARQNESDYALVIDPDSARLSTTQGEPLFGADGNPSAFLEDMRKFLEQIEVEVERTRLVGRRLLDLGILQPMRFDATLPSGEKVVVDGFLAIDEAKLTALPEADLADLTRTGLMKLIQAQLLSMPHMTRLVERRWQRSHHA